MKLFEPLVLTDSIEIKTKPETIWDFFINLEKNYKVWHPEDHVLFKWTRGKPMETGSLWYAEEVVHGKVFKLKGTIGEVIENRKIVFNYSFPISLAAPKFEWLLEPQNSTTIFTARSYLRAGEFYFKIARKEMERKIPMHNKHVREEGENLKRILENVTD